MSDFKHARIGGRLRSIDQALDKKAQFHGDKLEAMLIDGLESGRSLSTEEANAVTELVLRNCEASETVTQIVKAAFINEASDKAEESARQDFAAVAKAWPASRLQILESVLEVEIDRHKNEFERQQNQHTEDTQSDRLQERITLSAARCLDCAKLGDEAGLEINLRRLLLLRDVAVRCGYLSDEALAEVTAAFTLDIATEQIKGELDRIADKDPLQAIEYAFAFEPDVAEEQRRILKKRAIEIATVALKRQLVQKQTEVYQRRLQHRMAGLGYMVQRLQTYLSGQAFLPNERFQYDPHLRAFNNILLDAGARRDLVGDDPFVVRYLTSKIEGQPLSWAVHIIMRYAARGQLSWAAAVSLCNGVLSTYVQGVLPNGKQDGQNLQSFSQ